MNEPTKEPNVEGVPAHLGGHYNYTIMDEPVLDYLIGKYGIKNMLDVGCGPGGMIDYAKSKGIDALGVDGDANMKREGVLIHDYTKGLFHALGGVTFDLIWSVEFVEHVEEKYMKNFLTTFKQGKVLFMTHAQPMQGGHHHVNLQNDEYWIEKLKDDGWELDRGATDWVRDNSGIDPYIKKNALVFIRESKVKKIKMYGVEVELKEERADLIEGEWEKERLGSMMENIHSGSVVIDVGAEEGDMSTMMALKGARMALIEPSPSMWPRIKGNFERNKVTPLVCFAGFASNKTEESPLQGVNFDNTYNGIWPSCAVGDETNIRSFRHLSEEAIATPQITLDDFCARNNLKPDLITIDVEGSEYEVLEGARKVLTEGEPLVYVSVHENLMYLNYGHWFHNLYWEYLMDMGYRPTFLAHNHETHWLFTKTGGRPD